MRTGKAKGFLRCHCSLATRTRPWLRILNDGVSTKTFDVAVQVGAFPGSKGNPSARISRGCSLSLLIDTYVLMHKLVRLGRQASGAAPEDPSRGKTAAEQATAHPNDANVRSCSVAGVCPVRGSARLRHPPGLGDLRFRPRSRVRPPGRIGGTVPKVMPPV